MSSVKQTYRYCGPGDTVKPKFTGGLLKIGVLVPLSLQAPLPVAKQEAVQWIFDRISSDRSQGGRRQQRAGQ